MTDIGTIPDLPPPLSEDDAAFDPTRYGAIKVLWDLALIYGPASRADLHQHRPMISWNYREYVRWHPEAKGDHSSAMLRQSDKWAFDRAIDRSLERGWIVEQDGLLSVGAIPPEHVPLSTKGVEQVRQEVTEMESKEAIRILTAKANRSRKTPTRGGRALLAKSLRERGQRDPITVWQPHPMVWKDEIIVDGVTRAELLAEMGVEPKKQYLPPETTAAEVLLHRIDAEITVTSKDVSDVGAAAYVEQLAHAGIKVKDIVKAVELSERTVRRILSQSGTYATLGQPGKDEIARFVTLRDAGFALRDIADDTQWSKNTVARYLAAHDVGPQEAKPKGKAAGPQPLKPGSTMVRFLTALADLGEATVKEVLTVAGLSSPTVGGHAKDREFVRVVRGGGTGGDARAHPGIYVVTDLGMEYLEATGYTKAAKPAQEPEPEPASKPKLAAVPALPPPDVDEELIDLGFTKLQVIQILDVLARHGIEVPRRSRKAR